jgi:transposase-like protein
LVTEGGLSVQEASMRLSMPKSTLESWLRAFKSGKLERIGSSQRPLTEMEVELARVKRELALAGLVQIRAHSSRVKSEYPDHAPISVPGLADVGT